MVREFGPVLSAIMVAGRSGSAMTGEISTMKISEQVDALRTLGIDVQQYLTIPRLVATTLVLPLLSLFCSLCGTIGGYMVTVWGLKVNHELYIASIQQNVVVGDIVHGLIKAVIFGFLIALIATYKGFHTRGGAKDVGISITQSVVACCLTILIVDYILTSLLSPA
jgi:phospholipid/cholesterol/gamma-HCH transport system permease protein